MIVSVFIVLILGCHAVNKGPSQIIPPQQNDLNEIRWWSSMQDPVLNDLIERALKYNNQLLAAQANVLQAQAQLKAAYNAWLPTINASANGFGVRGWDTQITPQGPLAQTALFSNDSTLNIKGGYAGFVPNYSLNLLENHSNAKLANASLEKQKAMYRSMRLSIISQTVGSYFSLLGQKEQLLEQRRLIEHLQRLHRLEEVRHRDGASDYSTLASIEQEIASNQAQLASIENSMIQVQNALQLLINHDPGPVVTRQSLSALTKPYRIPPHIPARILQQRPDIMIAREELNQADAQLGLSYSRFFPQLSLTGLLGGSSVELLHLLKLTTGLGVAQIAAVMPVLNGVAYQQVQASKTGVKAAYFNYVHTVRAAFVDVDNALTKNQKNNEAAMRQLQAYHAAHRAYRIALARYKAGFQDRRVVVNALLTQDKARLALTVAQMEQLNGLVAVYQSLAGST